MTWNNGADRRYAPLGACPAHSGQHADCPVRRTLREVCYGMQPTASLSRAWRRSDARVPETVVVVLVRSGRSNSGSFCLVGRVAGFRSTERMLVQGQALRGDQGLGGCASRGRGEDDNAKTLVPDDVAVELEQA